MNAQLEALIDAAVEADYAPRSAVTYINGRHVRATVIEQYRITTGRKVQRPSISWRVDDKRVAAADLAKYLA